MSIFMQNQLMYYCAKLFRKSISNKLRWHRRNNKKYVGICFRFCQEVERPSYGNLYLWLCVLWSLRWFVLSLDRRHLSEIFLFGRRTKKKRKMRHSLHVAQFYGVCEKFCLDVNGQGFSLLVKEDQWCFCL